MLVFTLHGKRFVFEFFNHFNLILENQIIYFKSIVYEFLFENLDYRICDLLMSID